MKCFHCFAAPGLAACLLGAGLPAIAGEGHDHGDAAAAATGQALPRFAAVSESFELVGVLDGRQLTLYLDRFADNAPVRGAKIELEIAGAKHQAQAQGDEGGDAYQLVLKQPPQPGLLAITATVTAGDKVDLLAGELDLHPADHGDHDDEQAQGPWWKQQAGWVVGGLAAVLVMVVTAALLRGARRRKLAGPLAAGGAA